MKLIVGLDVGGTKVAIRAETPEGGQVLDTALDASGWEAAPAAAAASWLAEKIRRQLPPGAEVAALGVGAQGCDSPGTAADLRAALARRGLRATVVNDGALLVPAAGVEHGIGVVAGTGSIGVAADAFGNPLLAGGWGWVLGDEGGAAAIVRDATRAALAARDDGEADDGLLGALEAAYGVSSPEGLARAVNDNPTVENWAPHAPVVFGAADAGSALARRVVETAAGHLAGLVSRLVSRGAVGTTVVAAGSVIVRQPRLADAFGDQLSRRCPGMEMTILTDDPVAGAVALARRLL
jgi:N-acetylglucosamine kinase-like BadF-type ATPase